MIPVQRIIKNYSSPIDKATAYLAAILALNSIRITPGELELLAYMAVKGTITTPPVREGFMDSYSISKHRLKNIISSLYQKKLLYKDGARKTRLIPALQLDFKQPEQGIMIKMHLNETEG